MRYIKTKMTIPLSASFCVRKKNEAIVKYSVLNDAQQIFASRYRFALPTAKELQQEIEAERRRIEDEEG